MWGVGLVLICCGFFVKILYFRMVARSFSNGVGQGHGLLGLGSVPLEDGANALEEISGECMRESVGPDLLG